MTDRLDTAIANYQSTINEAAAEVRKYVSSVTESYLVILNSLTPLPVIIQHSRKILVKFYLSIILRLAHLPFQYI